MNDPIPVDGKTAADPSRTMGRGAIDGTAGADPGGGPSSATTLADDKGSSLPEEAEGGGPTMNIGGDTLPLPAPTEEAEGGGPMMNTGEDTLSLAAPTDGPSHASRPTRTQPVIPGYVIEAEVGRGGMGVVYRAVQRRLNRTVALKMILAGDHAGAEAGVRFLAEAEAIARLHHPHIVQIYHIDEHQGRPYFEMEYVGGGSLADRLDGQPRPPREAAGLVAKLALAVAEAHRLGIVHRDLKPGNILLALDGTPKVADFGLAKRIGADSGLTRTDSILGSPSYMAPEQAGGHAREVGPAADVYALGAILYEQLTGRPPLVGATILDTLRMVRESDPVPPSRLVPGLPLDIETIALKCLEKSPARRYATAEDLAGDLGSFLEGSPILARPVASWERAWKWAARRPAIAALGLALVIASASLIGVGVLSYARINAALAEAEAERGRAVRARNLETESRLRSDADRARADLSRNAALREAYLASLSESRALRAGHEPGWRDQALGNLARLATSPTDRRDVAELRTEALACLGEYDVFEVGRIQAGATGVAALSISPDGRTLATSTQDPAIELWDVEPLRHRASLPDPARIRSNAASWPRDPGPLARFRPDGGLAFRSWDHRLDLFDQSGRPNEVGSIGGNPSEYVWNHSHDRHGRRVAVGGLPDGSTSSIPPRGRPCGPSPSPTPRSSP